MTLVREHLSTELEVAPADLSGELVRVAREIPSAVHVFLLLLDVVEIPATGWTTHCKPAD